MSNKTIKINPVFFSKQKSTTKKKQPKRISSYNPTNTNQIKKSFIKKIKEFKKKQENDKKNNPIKEEIKQNDEQNDFNESIGFVRSLLKENKEKKNVREKMKTLPINNNTMDANITQFPKPPQIPQMTSLPQMPQMTQMTSLPQMPQMPQMPQIATLPQMPSSLITNKMRKNRTNKKRHNKNKKTIKLGKIKNKNLISILIPDNNQKLLTQEHIQKCKTANISKIKKFLRKRGLIKSGCLAPKSVLREIYESSLLTGDVYNNSKENLIHNFMSLE